MSGISALNIAKNALLSHQTAVNLTGTNIANVNTPGYSRQRPIFGMQSQAVTISGIERIYDKFLGAQIADQTQSLGYSESRRDALGRIEMIFNEADGGGISELMDKFWNGWEDLALNPSGNVERQALVSSAQNLATMFNSYSDGLLSVQNDADTQIQDLVRQVNGYVADIANFNDKIAEAETGGGDVNNLLDNRAELLKELAGIVDINYIKDSQGAINIFLSNGLSLVEGNHVWELDVKPRGDGSSFSDITFKDNPDETINNVVKGGKLAGFLEIRDTTAKGYMDQLNALATSIIEEVNAQHEQGFDINRNLGGAFFKPTTEPATAAGDMRVSDDIIADPGGIAASVTVNDDGGNAGIIGAFRDRPFDIGTDTDTAYNNYWASFEGRLGQDVANADRNLDNHTNLLNQLIIRQEQISGVLIDEEMMNLIKFQTGYEAAARLCSVADELIDTLFAMVQ